MASPVERSVHGENPDYGSGGVCLGRRSHTVAQMDCLCCIIIGVVDRGWMLEVQKGRDRRLKAGFTQDQPYMGTHLHNEDHLKVKIEQSIPMSTIVKNFATKNLCTALTTSDKPKLHSHNHA